MRRSVVTRRAFTVLLLAALVPQPASTVTSQEQSPTFKSQASFVRVDVYPTRNGTPVDNLRAEDFEVLEDGAPQTIAAFEHVVIGTENGTSRAEPSTADQSRRSAANPRSRLFVLFLDLPHVSPEASRDTAGPLINLLDRLLQPEDLIGVMTPAMRPSDLVFGRKTELLQSSLRERVPWGKRLQTDSEKIYADCASVVAQDRGRDMALRANERATLEALRELVDHLRFVRDERKAILTITEGWQLYRPTDELMKLAGDPGTGKTELVPHGSACERERIRLSSIDDERFFRELIDASNRANASFYVIDPRGVAVFDTSLEQKSTRGKPVVSGSGTEARIINIPGEPASASIDRLGRRQDVLRTLAANTDGIVVMNTDLDRGLRRISDDGRSYYLLGYYSTNSKLDGKFRALKVRIKQPGIDVRARRGYRAATEAEITSMAPSTAAPASAVSLVAAAIAALGTIRTDARLYVAAIPGTKEGPVATVWIAGELTRGLTSATAASTTAEIEVTAQGTSATSQVTLAPGNGGFVTPVKLPARMADGALSVRVHVAGTPDTDRESTRIDFAAGSGSPLLFRRGPMTGNRLQPASSKRFMRTERVHLEIPVAATDALRVARLLDKTGQPLALTLATGDRIDPATTQRWLTADLILAPLAMGDYAIETTIVTAAGEHTTVSAFRIVP